MADPFKYALEKRDFELMEKVLDKYEVDLNMQGTWNGSTYLIDACIIGDTELVEFLVKHGADINITDNKNKTALDYAIENDYENIVHMLIDNI